MNMKAIYIKPTTDVVVLLTKDNIATDTDWWELADSQDPNHTANSYDFFAEEDQDDDHDPFFDD